MTLIKTHYVYYAQMVYLTVIYCFKQPAEDLELMSSEWRCRCHLPNWLLHHILVMAPHV